MQWTGSADRNRPGGRVSCVLADPAGAPVVPASRYGA